METRLGNNPMLNSNVDEQNLFMNLFEGKDSNLDLLMDNFIFPDSGPQDMTNINPNIQYSDPIIDEALLSLDLGLPSDIGSSEFSSSHGGSRPSYKKHSKKPSGAAIFGIHGREMSIPGMGSIDLRDIMNLPSSAGSFSATPSPSREKHHRQLNKIIDPKAATLSKDYIITSTKPTSYKFPPDSSDDSSQSQPMRSSPQRGRLLHASPSLLSKPPQNFQMMPSPARSVFTPTQVSFPNNIDEILEGSMLPTPLSTANPSPIKSEYTPEKPHQEFPISTPFPISQTYNISTPTKRSRPLSMPMTPYTLDGPLHDDFSQNDQCNQLSSEEGPASKKRKSSEKVSTLPPGYIDQFIVGPDHNKKYICNYNSCGKVFQRRYNIRSHIQTHLCDRPYKCTFAGCSKSFVRQHDLHRHEKIHENSKFSCSCGKGFTRIDALRRHKERNICVGGLETDMNLNKPRRKRGRPRKVTSQENMNGGLDNRPVETVLSRENSLLQFETVKSKDEGFFIFDEGDKENSGTDSCSGKSSAPLTPISGNRSNNNNMPMSLRV